MQDYCAAGRWEVRRTKLGHPYKVWITPVPRIPDRLIDCIVYLYPSEAAAEDGEKQGGSGFICGVDLLLGGPLATYVVTNKHVAERGSKVVRVNTRDGRTDPIPLDGVEWFDHPDGDDISVCPIGLDPTKHSFQPFLLGNAVIPDWISLFKIGLGDDVFMIGRFVGNEGKLQNAPSVRFGVISQMPGEPIIQEDGFPQISYLVEARSIPGYSGSPVFIIIEGHGPKPQLNPDIPEAVREQIIEQMSGWMKERAGPLRYGPFLLGIDYCHFYDKQRIWSDATGKRVSDDWFVKGNSGAMGIIPAWRLKEMFEKHPKLMAHLESVKVQVLRDKAESRVSRDVAEAEPAAPASDANLNHREDFDRLLGAAVQSSDKSKA